MFCTIFLYGHSQTQCKAELNYAGCNIEVKNAYLYQSFQWYKNGNVINGATDSYYEADQGTYYIICSTLSGCSAKSRPFYVISWCGQGVSINQKIVQALLKVN
jgi:hypothetical protein